MVRPKRARTNSMSCGSGDWLVREIVDVPATKIHDAVFKVTLLTSFLADGELRLALTHQCVEDCDRALVVEDETERGLKALEPGLWAALNEFART
jgi:hypothetical protein